MKLSAVRKFALSLPETDWRPGLRGQGDTSVDTFLIASAKPGKDLELRRYAVSVLDQVMGEKAVTLLKGEIEGVKTE